MAMLTFLFETLQSVAIQDFEKGVAMISLRWISGFCKWGGEALEAEFALSTVASNSY